MSTLIAWIIILGIGLLNSNFKKKTRKSSENKEIKVLKKEKSKRVAQQLPNGDYTKNTDKKNTINSREKVRQIVDREKEIFSTVTILDREKIVNDIIFSEILSKPKSKR